MSARSWHQRSWRLCRGNHQDGRKATTTTQQYAMLPRVLEKTGMDTMDRSSPQQLDGPRRLSRIAKLQRKINAVSMGNLCPDKGTMSPQSSPAQNTHSKNNSSKASLYYWSKNNPARDGTGMHWNLHQGHPNTIATSTTCLTRIPHCNAQCSHQQ